MPKTKTTVIDAQLDSLTPDSKNANLGTPRGTAMLEESLRKYGAGRSILVDRNGRVIAGNKTLESAASIGLEDCLVVETDGTRIVAVKRIDLDLDSPQARALAIADNRISEINLEWSPEILQELAESDVDLTDLFNEEEWAELLNHVPDFQPVGSDEQGRLDEKAKVTCPECGCSFAPA